MVSKAQFEKIALSFDGVEKGTSYGHPAFVFRKKFFTRLRDEDASAVLFVGSLDEREMLMEVEPDIFHVTPHYKDYPIVLARLSKVDAKVLRAMLHRHWLHIAPKNLVKSSAPPAGAKRSTAGRGKTKKRA
jgi:hypothetical protein